MYITEIAKESEGALYGECMQMYKVHIHTIYYLIIIFIDSECVIVL